MQYAVTEYTIIG